jgi:S1-C subfamily serine protease
VHAAARGLGRATAGGALMVAIVIGTPTRTTPAGADFAPIDAQAALAVLTRSTVQVMAFGCNLDRNDGTAVAVGGGLLLTNAHVVAGSRLVDIVPNDAATQAGGEPLLAPAGDVAVVSDPGPALPTLALATQDPPPGSPVRVAGFPAGAPGLAIVATQVTDYADGAELGEPWPVMRLQAEVRPGMSGGPVLDAAGHLAGIVFGNELPDGRALAIPASRLRRLLAANAFTPTSC